METHRMSDLKENKYIQTKDGEPEDPISQLNHQLESLAITLGGNRNFKTFDEKNGTTAKEFIDQFLPYFEEWSDKKFLDTVSLYLEGNPKLWFKGGRNNLFKSKKEFQEEFADFYIPKEGENGKLNRIIQILSEGFKIGRLESCILELYSIQEASHIPLKDMLDVLCSTIPSDIANKLKEKRRWKEVILEARTLDLNFAKDKKIKNIPMPKIEKQPEPNKKKEPVCIICKGAHYPRRCPKYQKDFYKKQNEYDHKPALAQTIITEVKIGPRIVAKLKHKDVICLHDTGADENFINYSIASNLELKIESDIREISLAQGRTKSLGFVTLNLIPNDKENEAQPKFRVLTDLSEDIIIGYQTIKHLKIKLDPTLDRVSIFDSDTIKLAEASKLSIKLFQPLKKQRKFLKKILSLKLILNI